MHNKALENVIELGVNLVIAVSVLFLIATAWNLGRDSVITMEKIEIQQENADNLAEFSTLNGTYVTYARIVELVTHYAGELDIYVDSTADGGAILITSRTGCKKVPAMESWDTVKKNVVFPVTNTAARIGGLSQNYWTTTARMTAEAQTLLKADLTQKFGVGKWQVYVAVNNENVGTCKGRKVEAGDYVSGLRFQRIE